MRCPGVPGRCAGAWIDACYPYHVWSSAKASEGVYQGPFLWSGVIHYEAIDYGRGVSVRCLLLAFNGHAFLLFASLLSPSALVRCLLLGYLYCLVGTVAEPLFTLGRGVLLVAGFVFYLLQRCFYSKRGIFVISLSFYLAYSMQLCHLRTPIVFTGQCSAEGKLRKV